MNELFLRIAMDDIHRQMDDRHQGPNPNESYEEMDEDRHISRMQRLLNWQGTILGTGLKPGSRQIKSRRAIAS